MATHQTRNDHTTLWIVLAVFAAAMIGYSVYINYFDGAYRLFGDTSSREQVITPTNTD